MTQSTLMVDFPWKPNDCGYVRLVTKSESHQKSPRKREKAGKVRKPAKQKPKDETKAQYFIHVSEFVEMAPSIASCKPEIKIPTVLQKVFDRVISARKALMVPENTKLQNRFTRLTIEETDPLDELIVEVREKQLPKIEPLPVEQDEDGLEEDFLFAIATFLKDISNVRTCITRERNGYARTGEGLRRTSVLFNTAVDLVRSAEHQFDQIFVRPKR
ncbi:hypothetical protein G6011_01155 [Alternaria panax]|uniref:DUF6604 domain-containing protein n=1 Tax=Alternaria panax TaxID=48097 RepID=A0AAD4IK79_9PLEO|nr:hypothetical protein G6011_01155 [Alternaria panax]